MIRPNLGILFLFAVAMSLAGPRAARAAESYDNCTGFITSLPAVITAQGTWCLKQDLTTSMVSGNAITIATDNVTIDCNDFKISGMTAGLATSAYGIYAVNRLNATVRNCQIRGFFFGLFIWTSSVGGLGGHLIENNRFEGNTGEGLRVEGSGSTVRRNRVIDTGGSTVAGDAYGIVTGESVDILDNTVFGVIASNGPAIGITVFGSSGTSASINGNHVRGLLTDGTDIARGIYVGIGRFVLQNNDVVGTASTGSIGIVCGGTAGTGRAKDNVTNGFVTGLNGCSDDGGNVIAP